MHDILNRISTPEGLAIVFGFPIAFFLVGIVLQRRRASGRPATPPLIMRYLVLPSAFVFTFSIVILRLPADHLVCRLLMTVLATAVMSFLISAMNYLLFSEYNVFTKRETIPKLGRDILNVALTLVAAGCVLSDVWGFDLGNLIAALGVSSLVVGLALQQVLGNLFNGISLMMARPFAKGDWVSIDGGVGRVVNYSWRSVKIVTRDNELIVIPNSVMSAGTLINYSRPHKPHAEVVKIGFSYDDQPQNVKLALFDMLSQIEGVLQNPQPVVETISYDDFAITYRAKFFISDYKDALTIRDRVLTELYNTARAHGFRIPFPIREVILHGSSAE